MSASLQRPSSIPSVGMTGRIDGLVLPGSELELAPLTSNAPVAVRIVATYPHGDAFRYDLEYWGFEPGHHDLRACLQRVDGSATDDLPAIDVEVASLLAPGQVLPHTLESGRVPRFGGYVEILFGLGILWFAVLGWLLYSLRARRAASAVEKRPASFADMLQPLVERASRGELSPSERALLELGLAKWWQARLGWTGLAPVEARQRLRAHEQAGPLLTRLEDWLHRPPGATRVDAAELARILSPYRQMPAAEFDALARSGANA
ncbi:MAG: hypothetical protein EPO68_11820 [Planctomycetota bacterium]|nr:MAG: hypothetical protein EPO68_11820 [Planctomycetota bacterium]